MKKRLRIYLADDHNLFRKAMGSLLRTFDRIDSVEEAANGKELLDLFKISPPDVAIVDLQMPVMDGIEACENILAKWSRVKIIVLSMHGNNRYVRHLVELGVHAFLLKNADVEELQRALYAVIDHDFYRNDIVTMALNSQAPATEPARPTLELEGTGLTPRERQILRLVYEEYTIKGIGERLSISENTVRNHRVNIMKKAGVTNLVGLIKYAYAAGIVMERQK